MVIPRRVTFLGLAAVILAGAGIAAAANYEEDEDTPAALEQVVTTTTSLVPADTTTTVDLISTTTAPAPSTTVAGATTTTRRATTTTTRAAATTTTTGPVIACTNAQIEAAVSTDKGSYAPGESVGIHSTLRNRSTCTYPSFIFSATVLSPGGAMITGFDRQGDAPGSLGPGQAHEARVNWDRLGCAPQPCTQNPPGTYSVSVTWHFPGGPFTANKPFTLT